MLDYKGKPLSTTTFGTLDYPEDVDAKRRSPIWRFMVLSNPIITVLRTQLYSHEVLKGACKWVPATLAVGVQVP